MKTKYSLYFLLALCLSIFIFTACDGSDNSDRCKTSNSSILNNNPTVESEAVYSDSESDSLEFPDFQQTDTYPDIYDKEYLKSQKELAENYYSFDNYLIGKVTNKTLLHNGSTICEVVDIDGKTYSMIFPNPQGCLKFIIIPNGNDEYMVYPTISDDPDDFNIFYLGEEITENTTVLYPKFTAKGYSALEDTLLVLKRNQLQIRTLMENFEYFDNYNIVTPQQALAHVIYDMLDINVDEIKVDEAGQPIYNYKHYKFSVLNTFNHWYFISDEEYDDVYMSLFKANKKYPGYGIHVPYHAWGGNDPNMYFKVKIEDNNRNNFVCFVYTDGTMVWDLNGKPTIQ